MKPIWSGSIAFGLVNIPVQIYSAFEERVLHFKLLDKYGHCPISYLRICRDTHKEIPYQDIVKGYEYQKGDYVIISDKDFEKVAPKKTKTINILQFSDESEIDEKYIDKPYFIEPDVKAQKAYVLLREALKRSKKVAVASWVLRNKEHIALVRPEGKMLMLIQLRYTDEIRNAKNLNIPAEEKYSKQELSIALTLIKQLEKHFNATQYHDTYTEELKKIIEKKAKGEHIKVPREGTTTPTDMRHLMSILKKSLEQEKRKHHHVQPRTKHKAHVS